MKINQEYWTTIDMDGNFLYLEGHHLYLKLKGKKRERDVGTLSVLNEQLYYKTLRRPEDVFHKFNAWGLCWSVIERLPDEGMVLVFTPDATYSLPRTEVVKYGKFLDFKKAGYEKQIFVPLEHWIKQEINYRVAK